ncbi:mannitol operon transcriptional antiterminator [Streptococcus varani]|uniref:Mannitol operon transcriptional antiterminator n=1 Tax=Streptococcus varani TaxID=1608583 RepID=A0A0E4H4P3_9STRE|nr:PTS sugar transporter subunit IIA [Streptococcus varani]CQR25483.1 mannitol operon transcriptional antiterminator [Streptococcus varani]
MLLTKREEQLVRAFLQVGKLSLKEMADILQVSSRTVYRTLSDLMLTLEKDGIELIKDGRKYFLSGDLSILEESQSTDEVSASHRLILTAYQLLTSSTTIINEELQEQFWVSNVTVIQDVADIESRLKEFDLTIQRKRGYQVTGTPAQKRRFLAILLSNAISIQDFWNDHYPEFPILEKKQISSARRIFEEHQHLLGEVDSKLREFLIILLGLADNQDELLPVVNVSKEALDFSKHVFADLAKVSKKFYNLQEIIYFANILDQVIIKRQEIPLFREKFDSEFYYSISQMIDAVSRFTKINFFKDKLLFKLLFNHVRLSLAVPILFPEKASSNVAYLAAQQNKFLHSIVSLVMRDIFPAFIQNEFEYELVTLHFASSLRRSPDIYPIRLLLVTDERPLTTSVLISKIKNIAPFVELIDVQSTTNLSLVDSSQYDYCLTTKPIPKKEIDLISTFPNTQEILDLQEKLQLIQENRTVAERHELQTKATYDLQKYLEASSQILRNFELISVDNPLSFDQTVGQIVGILNFVTDAPYLTAKLLSRFELSPLAIPNTNLALLHTQSHTVNDSHFLLVELKNTVSALSMNHQNEEVKRVLVMLTKLNEQDEIRDMMTAISQSIIENNLYTEIYRTGNQEIIYQLLNTIFTEKIKKLEN